MTISPVTAIFRDIEYEKLKIILEAMKNTPIKSIEIAMNSLNANEILKRTIKDFGSDFTIGAGTVINLEILKEVIELGVKFVLSPTTFAATSLSVSFLVYQAFIQNIFITLPLLVIVIAICWFYFERWYRNYKLSQEKGNI